MLNCPNFIYKKITALFYVDDILLFMLNRFHFHKDANHSANNDAVVTMWWLTIATNKFEYFSVTFLRSFHLSLFVFFIIGKHLL